MVLKVYQERLVTLVKDTLTLLCKNGLEYSQEFAVEGLLGITLDKGEVFLIPINELVKDKVPEIPPAGDDAGSEAAHDSKMERSPKRKKKRRHADSGQVVAHDESSFDPGAGDWDEDVKERLAPDTNTDTTNLDNEPTSKRHRNSQLDLADVKAEDIVVIKEEDDDEDFEGFQNNSVDDNQFNQTEQSGDGLPFFSQPGTSQGDMNFSLEQLPGGSGIPGAMGVLPPGVEGDVQSWLQQSQDGSQGDWQGGDGEGGQKQQGHQCSRCYKVFSYANNLQRHVKSVHSTVTALSCQVCGKVFSRSDSLHRHMANVHGTDESHHVLRVNNGNNFQQ